MEQAIFENFDFLVKVKVLLSQSFFFFFFLFLFFCRRFGPGQVSRSVQVKPRYWRMMSSMTSCVEGTCQRLARQARGWVRWRMKLAPMMSEARGLSSGPEIFGSCRSEVDGSNGGIGFVKKFSDSCRFE